MKNVLKFLMVVSILLSSMVFPVLGLAIFQEEQVKKPNHIPGEFIIKFKDEAVVGAVSSELVQRRQAFREITGDSHLDDLNAQYKVKAMHRLFGKKGPSETITGRIDIATAKTLHRQQLEQFKAEIAAFRGKRLKKKGLQRDILTDEKNVPYLSSIYRVVVDPKADIEETCRNYAQDRDVAYCQPNYRMEAQWMPDDSYYSSVGSWGQSYDDMWGLKKLQTETVWDTTKGAGVIVAVVDTGIDNTHPDIAANIWTNSDEIAGNGIDDDGNGFIDDVQGWNFVSSNNTPVDGHGHGTHCSGTIAAIGNNGSGVIGVAPLARIMPVKVLSDSGSGYSSNIAAGIRYAADNGADIISNSWGCNGPCPSNPVVENAVKYAHDLGAVVVVAAGNNGTDLGDVTQYSPQNQSNSVITVAASTELDTRSYFSTIGSLIAVTAPGGGADGTSSNYSGRNILSLRAGTTDMYGGGTCIVGGTYYRSRGTSMAAPHVAGVAALVLANHPEYTPDDVKQVLRVSADDIESPGFDLLSGAGRVNAAKALNIASVPKVRITSPVDRLDVSGGTVAINGDAYGTNFVKYQLFYATIDKTNNNPYAPVLGAWQPLGVETSQSVTNGVLGSFASSIFQAGLIYLIKLQVTTTDNLQFIDIKEVAIYAPGTTPDQFTFIAQTGVTLSTVITSNTITVSGITAAAPISITGGAYSINGGEYTSAGGTVVNGDTVTLQQTSSESYATTTTATLTIGGVSGAFSVTTQASSGDTTPDPFTFTAQTGVELSMLITSNAITVSGINMAAPISIEGGGAYSINGSSYSYSSGTVNNGDTVTVQLPSSWKHSTTTSTILTIGTVSGTFSVTTHQFHFTSQAGMDLSTVTTSDTITVSWISTETPISITGGTYSINGGIYTSASGTVVSGNTVTVRQTSSASYATTTDAILTIGDLSAVYSVTTKSEFGDRWTQKTDFGGGPRDIAVGFSIGSKGYIGTGANGSVNYAKDFWEYDPVTNRWTQKADFAGAARQSAVGFSIGSKGYIGTGRNSSSNIKDFWEYDPSTNIWTQKADFGGEARYSAVGFSIGNNGYIGTGIGSVSYKDFWQYDPSNNTWTKKADFGGTARYSAVGFAIGDRGYIGTGNSSSSPYYCNDFWEYNPVTNIWIKKADFGGTGRGRAIGFAIGSKAYIGTGAERESPYKKNDFWEYDQAIDTWTRRADLRGAGRYYADGFSIGSKGYIGTGYNSSSSYLKDFWEYEPVYTPDMTPDQFTFTLQTGVPLSTVITSNTITVSGINAAAAISITGGKYSVNGGDYTSVGGTVVNNDNVTLQLTSSSSYSSTASAVLTIGGISGTFSVTTLSNGATSINMTFEGLTDWEIVGDYYNGGYGYDYNTGLSMSGPGPDYGVVFKASIQAAINTNSPSTGMWRREPTPHTAIGFQQGGAWINVARGFTGSLSFYYGNPNNNSKIYIYDGLDRTGNLLATLDLPKTGVDTDGALLMVYASVSFSGTARSVDFSEEASSCFMDDITLGNQNRPVIPNPPTRGVKGSNITINGSNFGDTQGNGYVDFNGVRGIIVSWSNTQIVVKIPGGATSGCMKVVTDYGTSECIDFTVSGILYTDFTGAGIWQYDGSNWSQLNVGETSKMTASGNNLYANFEGYGLWQWNGTQWSQLNPSLAANMTASGSNLYVDFAGYGLWAWNGTTWTQINTSNSTGMTASGTNLYANFSGYGIWKWNGVEWNQIDSGEGTGMTASGSNLYANFTGYGIWQWNGTTWSQINTGTSTGMTVSGTNLYVNFAGYGLWQWNGTTWTQLNAGNTTGMAATGGNLYGNFAGYGLWKWDGSTWSQINTGEPAIMVGGE